MKFLSLRQWKRNVALVCVGALAVSLTGCTPGLILAKFPPVSVLTGTSLSGLPGDFANFVLACGQIGKKTTIVSGNCGGTYKATLGGESFSTSRAVGAFEGESLTGKSCVGVCPNSLGILLGLGVLDGHPTAYIMLASHTTSVGFSPISSEPGDGLLVLTNACSLIGGICSAALTKLRAQVSDPAAVGSIFTTMKSVGTISSSSLSAYLANPAVQALRATLTKPDTSPPSVFGFFCPSVDGAKAGCVTLASGAGK